MAYDAVYTDRYVHYAAAGGGDGSLASPWTFAEAAANVVNGDRVNVEEGTYYLEGGGAFVPWAWCPAARSGSNTQPVLWRGWKSATSELGIASLRPGASWLATNFIEFKTATATAGLGRWTWCAQNFDIRLPNSYPQGILSGGSSNQGCVVFVNCYIENTYDGSPNYCYITDVLQGFFIGCHLKNANRTNTAANSFAFASNKNRFLGCYIEPFHSMQAAPPNSGVFAHNIIKSQNGYPAHTEPSYVFKNGTDIPNTSSNNVIIDFVAGFLAGSSTTMTITLLNNLFYNVDYPIKYQSTGSTSELILYGNYCYGADQSFPESVLGPMQRWGADYPGIVPLAEDPFRGNGDWRLVSSLPVNGAVPKYLYKEAFDPTTDGLISLDSGALQVEPEIDYPSQTDVRDGVQYANGFFTGDVRIPVVANVRDGVIYDSPDVLKEKEGTLVVPAASDVKLDVPVDDTLGTFDARRDITFKDSSSVS